jgi:hypothetical protein
MKCTTQMQQQGLNLTHSSEDFVAVDNNVL